MSPETAVSGCDSSHQFRRVRKPHSVQQCAPSHDGSASCSQVPFSSIANAFSSNPYSNAPRMPARWDLLPPAVGMRAASARASSFDAKPVPSSMVLLQRSAPGVSSRLR